MHESLDIILEDEPALDQPFDRAMDIVHQLRDAQQRVADLQHELSSNKLKIIADFALALRRAKPSLNIGVDKTGCKIGYKTKYLCFTPDAENGIWRVTSTNRRFLREFLKANNRAILLTADTSILITAIIDYFNNYYRTLNEELTGNGLLMIEGHHTNLINLVNWREQVLPIHLNSRSRREQS